MNPVQLVQNRAINFSLLNKAWQAGAGLITIPMVVYYLGPVLQGYYYTFSSLIALQSFFELGLSIVISVYASHEWHKLGLDDRGKIVGEGASLSRLVSLGHFVFKYYGIASIAYLVIAGGTGFYLLGREHAENVEWVTPWLLHITFSAATLWLVPFLSLLEGCDQMASVAKFRFIQSVVSNLFLWGALAAGFRLWALPLFAGVGLLLLIGNIGWRKKQFFSVFLQGPGSERLSWRGDLFRMQWRLAIQGLFGYMSFPLFTVLAYAYLGAVEAGRMGMSLQVVSGIQSFALVFLIARAPEFALLAASGKQEILARNCWAATYRSMGVMAFFCLLVVMAVWIASSLGLPQASRVLGAGSFAILSLGVVLTAPIQGAALYLRAHKRELMTAVGVVTGLLYGASAWWTCIHYGSLGMAASYALVTGLVTLPLALVVLKANAHRLRPGF